MVEQRLEDGEITEVLVGQHVIELADLVRDIGLALEAGDDGLADFPIQIFNLGLVRQVEQTEREHLLRVLFALLRVMTGLKLVQLVQIFFDVQQLAHQRMLAVAVLKKIAGPDLFNRSEHFHDQHAVMRDDGAVPIIAILSSWAASTTANGSLAKCCGIIAACI